MSETKAAEVKVPKEGEFEKGKLWYSRRGTVLTIGLTNLAIENLGEIEEIALPEEGDHIDAGDDVVTIDGTRTSISVTLPTKGLVISVNPVASDPSAVSEDPLDEGWLIKFQIDDLTALLDLEG